MDKQGIFAAKFGNRKTTIVMIVISVLIVAAFLFAIFSGIIGKANQENTSDTAGLGQGYGTSELSYEAKAADMVHMSQTITAGGKVNPGQTTRIQLQKGRTLKAVNVEDEEAVVKGQALVYYTDGSHTDAPSDGVIRSISTPANGSTLESTDSISFSSTQDLYLKIVIAEDQIHEIHKGQEAEITINAQPKKKFQGRIIGKKDISTTLLSEMTSDSDDEETDSDAAGSDDSDEDVFGEKSDSAYYAVNISFPNDKTVKPGMSANCTITISDRDNVLAVPVQAVYFDKKGQAFVDLEKGTSQQVEIGESNPEYVEISKGISRGDKVLVPVIKSEDK